VRVRPNHDECVDGHLVEVLGFADDAEDDVGQFRRWFEEQPALQGAGCDLDERIRGNAGDQKWKAA
jgi:hypothetical protein